MQPCGAAEWWGWKKACCTLGSVSKVSSTTGLNMGQAPRGFCRTCKEVLSLFEMQVGYQGKVVSRNEDGKMVSRHQKMSSRLKYSGRIKDGSRGHELFAKKPSRKVGVQSLAHPVSDLTHPRVTRATQEFRTPFSYPKLFPLQHSLGVQLLRCDVVTWAVSWQTR